MVAGVPVAEVLAMLVLVIQFAIVEVVVPLVVLVEVPVVLE
jgi:hypothetical protein